ncbi:KGK domain-containing protein [Microcoleus sp. FACHB-672]|uniref:KGK domain-containing protein n=1 Tax=Microcoleus sp. FACHB-672 TaxID=2692825 RepID=UPI001683286D|nr:KGK domain-containing protein [Microcoleus sp. FACHB-672]MBD2042791.1 hypothetical protein [Microcoleus sp. FACHB-672]
MPFEPIDEGDHVFSIEEKIRLSNNNPDKVYITSDLSKLVSDYVVRNLTGNPQWTTDGVKGRLLKMGSSRWILGKIRIKIAVEFCPDEPPSTSELEEFRQ